jgi:hypothetical protein
MHIVVLYCVAISVGKELWWLFQPLDSAIEGVMNELDADIGPGMGSKVMKVFLLLLPVAALLVWLGYRALTTGPAEPLLGLGLGLGADFSSDKNLFGIVGESTSSGRGIARGAGVFTPEKSGRTGSGGGALSPTVRTLQASASTSKQH